MADFLLCYITDRCSFPGDESSRRARLLEKIGEATACGIDYIQLREKDLSARHLEALVHDAVQIVRRGESGKRRTHLLINSRVDVSLAVGADGVNLRRDDLSPQEVKAILERCSDRPAARRTEPIIGVSCHTPEEVARAAQCGATFAVFGPVFGKKDAPEIPPAGIELLHRACQNRIPVLALGGITIENARECLQAGAAGVAAVRLFQENSIAHVIAALRS